MIGRRGFLGYLAGLLLASKIGPLNLPAPSPEIWKAAPQLPPLPAENGFVTLSQFLGRTIEIVHEETKWLRLERALGGRCGSRYGLGDQIMMRPPMRFKPEIGIDWSTPPQFFCDQGVPVTIHNRIQMNLDGDLDWKVPFDLFSRRNIEPLAFRIADQIASAVKRNGGAELIVCAQQKPYDHLERSLSIANEDLGLALLGSQSISPNHGMHVVRIEMIYGLA